MLTTRQRWLVTSSNAGAGSYANRIVRDYGANLLGYWPLDAEYGLTDLSGGGHNGTAGGGVTIGGAAGPGSLTATDFDGTDDRVTTGLNPFVNGTVRTFEAWANRDTNTSEDAFLSGDATASHPTIRLPSGTDTLRFNAAFGGASADFPSSGIGTGSWRHVMVVFDEPGNTVVALVNGVSLGSQAMADPYNATPGNFVIGQRNGAGTGAFDGKGCHVVIANGDYSSLAAAHYNAGRS